ncbi:hypothetical protein BX600DRAFT_70762 [Xylariales sp. PMI_506]|nr:hypothetical protein BX600DRAFT_70762 [Xylariales sp. PMI_506]
MIRAPSTRQTNRHVCEALDCYHDYLEPTFTMATEINFGDANAGFQVGIANGSVNTKFHHHAPPERVETPPQPSASCHLSNLQHCTSTNSTSSFLVEVLTWPLSPMKDYRWFSRLLHPPIVQSDLFPAGPVGRRKANFTAGSVT